MELTGTLPRYNTMHETSGVLYIPTTKRQSLYSYQVSHLDMLGTYPIADIYMKLSGIEMYTCAVAGMAGYNTARKLSDPLTHTYHM